jgi:predicted MFS family arabinose efflux permease
MLVHLVQGACWIAGLLAIMAYIGAFLRNRPYVRPFNALGLLLLGGALLGIPNLVARAAPDRPAVVVSVTILLVLSVAVQVVSAFRRRRAGAAEARA